MSSYLILFIIILWCSRIVINILSFIHLWFVKEYRVDRMLVHFKTKQGKWLYFLPAKFPPISPKTIIVFLITIIFLCIIYVSLTVNFYIKIFILDLLSFPLISILVLILSIPTKIYHTIQIQKATNKIKKFNIQVIGITGSFGKTSTKEFLKQILATKYQVISTQASKNSAIGISEVILHDLNNQHQIFVVEMGAYKIGEIEQMTKMVHPQVGIITAINAQHQDLFGSIENTKNTKYELIKNLNGKKIAILNADNDYILSLVDRAKKDAAQVWLYSTRTDNINDLQIRANQITSDLTGIKFEIIYKNEIRRIQVPIIGEHQVSNILAAILGSIALGMKINEIIAALTHLKSPPKTTEIVKSRIGAILVNDTFNNNPDAAIAAIKILKHAKGKKIFVMQPMIELGRYAEIAHEQVGKEAGKICDEIILTNKNFNSSFIKGVHLVNPNKKIQILNAGSASIYLQKIIKKNDLVVFKGKEAEFVLKRLV